MAAPRLHIGIDLDNTMVCYDEVFARRAATLGLGCVEPRAAKTLLRNTLRSCPGGEVAWTECQGEAYGPGLVKARPFPDTREVIAGWLHAGHTISVISHKTRFAALGPAHDFHAAARVWFEHWFGDLPLQLFLEPTRWAKLRRIESQRCDVFVDDLLDLLEEPAFPAGPKRIWYSPDNSISACSPAISRAASWAGVAAIVDQLAPAPCTVSTCHRGDAFTGDPAPVFSALVAAHLSTTLVRWEKLAGGINNLSARLTLGDGREIVGKIYRRSSLDPRDRLRHETAFLGLLEEAGITCVPRVLAIDEDLGAALHTIVPGRRWPDNEPAPAAFWAQCNDFIAALQRAAALPAAQALPLAAESALTLQEHLAWVQERRDLWLGRALDGALPAPAAQLVLDDLEPTYAQLARRVIAHPDFQTRLDRSTLILSPSDFGLHNALVADDGTLGFVDFEYAGWDDPAKTDADFSLQPRHAAGRPPTIASLDARLDRTNARTALLRELLALKWRYIVLTATVSRENTPAPCATAT